MIRAPLWTRWFPWKWLASWAARSLGFVDPLPVLERLERLSRPSEVSAPVELLRAGAVFHARGLVNARAIQYHLDWAWPWWVVRQYDPTGESFVPRAFALTHVNLTHRNWTAVGLPDVDRHPLVDPRGMTTPLYDGWSVDAWLVDRDGAVLLPAEAPESEQVLVLDAEESEGAGLEVRTTISGPRGRLTERVDVVADEGPRVRIRVRAEGRGPGWLAVALRPANAEGVASISRVERVGPAVLRVDGATDVELDRAPGAVLLSTHAEGDVLRRLPPQRAGGAPDLDSRNVDPPDLASRNVDSEEVAAGNPEPGELEPESPDAVDCPAGLATAAALFPLDADGVAEVSARIDLVDGSAREPGADVRAATGSARPASQPGDAAANAWSSALERAATLETPDVRFRFLYEAALRTLVLHSPGDVYPGPYTYKRFWFRDAAFILDALCSVGLTARARRALDRFPARQERSGYFRSQEGEWDSNGAALWAMDRYLQLADEDMPDAWRGAVDRGARWIAEKRVDSGLDAIHAGLLPAGFSAEHLGPNDHYYWDAFWCAAGLRAAARMESRSETGRDGRSRWRREAEDLLAAVDRSLAHSPGHRETGGVPASPYRPMDAGAIGSLAVGYPLRLWSGDDRRLLSTAEHLVEHHSVRGGFFQDMIHSGINAYLTLHIAQVMLRAGDPRQEGLVRTVADLASPTGQWPEAIHPRTGGGCMGDGQHAWAAAEWVSMMRSWFVREEEDRLVLASGIPTEWTRRGAPVSFGPTPTPWGPVTVRVEGSGRGAVVEWTGGWRGPPPLVEVRVPGHAPATAAPGASRVRVDRLSPGGGSPPSP